MSTQNDLVKVDTNALLGKQQTPSESGISYTVVSIKVPVIVLISALTDESKIKKSENIFILRVPFDAKSIKKILIFLKKYYLACINQLKTKQQQSAFFQGGE